MSENIKLTSPEAILKLVELIFSIIIGGLIGDIPTGLGAISKSQTIDVGIYGYLVVNLLLVYALIVKFDLPKNTRLAIAVIGSIVYLVCGALLLEYFDKTSSTLPEPNYGRILSAGIFSIFQTVIYIVDSFFVFKSG